MGEDRRALRAPGGGSDRVIEEARSWIGTPYRHQASLKGVGCDCLGLIRGVWRAVIGAEPEPLPPYAPDWAEAALSETLLAAAERHLIRIGTIEPGAVLLFRWRAHLPAKHAGIATGTAMLHAQEAAVVCEAALSPWWRRRVAGVFRFPEV